MGDSQPIPLHEHRLCDAKTKFLAWKSQVIPRFFVINCDGSFRALGSTIGYGNIIRDYSGRFIFAKAARFQNDTGVELDYGVIVVIIEMLAILDGLRYAQMLGLSYIQIQSDSKIVIAIIHGSARCPCQCLRVYYEILSKLLLFKKVEFNFIYRECNKATNFLSKFLNSDGEQCFGSSELPEELQKIIIGDALGFDKERVVS